MVELRSLKMGEALTLRVVHVVKIILSRFQQEIPLGMGRFTSNPKTSVAFWGATQMAKPWLTWFGPNRQVLNALRWEV